MTLDLQPLEDEPALDLQPVEPDPLLQPVGLPNLRANNFMGEGITVPLRSRNPFATLSPDDMARVSVPEINIGKTLAAIPGQAGDVAGVLWEEANKPLIYAQPPQSEVQRVAREGTQLEKRAMGVRQGIDEFLSGLTSPVGIATMGLAKVPALGKAAGLIFAFAMGREAVDPIAKELGTEFGKPKEDRDNQKIARLLTAAGLTAGMTAGIGADISAPVVRSTVAAHEAGKVLRSEPLDLAPIEPEAIRGGKPLAPENVTTLDLQPVTESPATPKSESLRFIRENIDAMADLRAMKEAERSPARVREQIAERNFPVPESPATMEAQHQLVAEGRTPAMLVTPGEEMPALDPKLSTIETEHGTFVFNPELTTAAEIENASKENRFGKLIGLSTESKPVNGEAVLQTTDAKGIPLKEEVVSRETLPAALEAAQKIVPENGKVELKSPEEVLEGRLRPIKDPLTPKQRASADAAANAHNERFRQLVQDIRDGKEISVEDRNNFRLPKDAAAAKAWPYDKIDAGSNGSKLIPVEITPAKVKAEEILAGRLQSDKFETVNESNEAAPSSRKSSPPSGQLAEAIRLAPSNLRGELSPGQKKLFASPESISRLDALRGQAEKELASAGFQRRDVGDIEGWRHADGRYISFSRRNHPDATNPRGHGQFIREISAAELYESIARVRQGLEKRGTKIVSQKTAVGGSRYLDALIDGRPWTVRIADHENHTSNETILFGKKIQRQRLEELAPGESANHLEIITDDPKSVKWKDIVEQAREQWKDENASEYGSDSGVVSSESRVPGSPRAVQEQSPDLSASENRMVTGEDTQPQSPNPVNPSFNPPRGKGAASKLISVEVTPGKVKAARTRLGRRSTGAEKRLAVEEEARRELFERNAFAPRPNTEPMPVSQLYRGEQVKFEGHPMRLMDFTFDEANRPDGVILEGAYGRQTVSADQVLHIDKGSSLFPPGPGARTINTDFPVGSELHQLTQVLEQTANGNQTVSERFGFARKLADRISDGMNATARALNQVKAGGAAVWQSYRTLPKYTDFQKSLGDWQGALQKADYEAREFVKEIRSSVKSAVRREAITNWIQAGGDESLLAQRAAKSKGSLKTGYEEALKLTRDEKIMAGNISQYFDAQLVRAQEVGLLNDGIENYVNQIWKRENPITKQLTADIQSGKLQSDWKAARKRVFESYFAGEQAGFVPATKDIGNLVAISDQSFNRVVAGRAFIRQLHEMKASDGRPLVEVSGNGRMTEAEEGKGTVFVQPKVKPEQALDYKPLDHPALRKWKWASNAADGTPVFVQGDMLVHPEIYSHLKNALGSSALRKVPLVRSILRVQSVVKRTMFSLSPFHQVQEGTHAMGHRVNPLKTVKLDFNDPAQMELVNHGLQVADFDAWMLFEEGLAGGGPLINKVPVIGPLQKAYTEWLFHEHIPRLKMTMAMDAAERNLKRYAKEVATGKISRDDLLALTARQANAAFGELNYKMMGRNPTLQDVFRTFLVAPDFLEARSRFVGQALKPYGREQLMAIGLIGAAQYMTARILNQLLDDDPHWNRPFEIMHRERVYSMRTVPADVEEVIEDFRRFSMNRLSPLVGRGLVEGITGRDYRGVKQDAANQLGDLLTAFIPMSLRSRHGDTLWFQALNASGLRTRPLTAVQQMRGKAAEFNKRTAGVSPVEILGESVYSPLRQALQENDPSSARLEFIKLVRHGRGAKQIAEVFRDAARAPFAGSAKREEEFKRALSLKDRQLYERARREQQMVYDRFRQITGAR